MDFEFWHAAGGEKIPDNLVTMGYVGSPFGIKGWVNVQPSTERLDGLLDYQTWWLGSGDHWKPYTVEQASAHPKKLTVKLNDVADRTVAALLTGKKIAVPRPALPALENDAFYWHDLIGSAVINQDGEALGTVETLLPTGANDVLVLRHDHGTSLLPFIAEVIVSVDQTQITVNWEKDY